MWLCARINFSYCGTFIKDQEGLVALIPFEGVYKPMNVRHYGADHFCFCEDGISCTDPFMGRDIHWVSNLFC